MKTTGSVLIMALLALASSTTMAGSCPVNGDTLPIKASLIPIPQPATPIYRPIAELTRQLHPHDNIKANGVDLGNLVLGITNTTWFFDYRIDVTPAGERGKETACFKVQNIDFKIGIKEQVVNLGEELRGLDCLSEYAWAHEREHVEFNTKLNAKAVEEATAHVAQVFQAMVFNQGSLAEAQKFASATLSSSLLKVTHRLREEGARGNARLDEILDARSFYRSCPADVAQVVQRLSSQ